MTVDTSRLRRDRALFYLGLVLFLAGVPGLILGSLLHDLMRMPVVGETFDAWGWINQTAAILGIALTAVGAAMLAISMRGGAIEPTEVADEGGAT